MVKENKLKPEETKLAWIGAMVTSLLIIIIFLLKFNYDSVTGTNANSTNEFRKSTTKPEPNLISTDNLTILSRFQWLAQPPIESLTKLITPVPYVIIGETSTENCSTEVQCVFQVRFIQSIHLEGRHLLDISYNFLIGGDGQVYKGRGWEFESAENRMYNSKSIGIAFIGTFNNLKPSREQIIACEQLIEKGVILGFIKEDYKILTANSSGSALVLEIKKMPKWLNNNNYT